MTTIPGIDELVSTLKAQVEDPAKKELLASIAQDAAKITMLAVSDREAAAEESTQIRSHLSGLASAEIAQVRQAWQAWAESALSAVIKQAIPL